MKVWIFITCVLRGAVSNNWNINIPQHIDAINGSCVQIPCGFEIPETLTQYLNQSVKAVWKKTDPMFGSIVFNSGSETSLLKGRLTGSLLRNNCTTVFQDLPVGSSDIYFFRLQGPAPLIYTFTQGVTIEVHEEPLAPLLSPSVEVLEVSEGTNVTLECSAVLSCPSPQPLMNWNLILGTLTKPTTQVDASGQTLLVSSQTFTAGPLHDKLNVSCSLLYISKNSRSETSTSLRVLYAPRSTTALVSPSGPASEGCVVTLSCRSDANPAVQRYEWYTQSEDGKLVLKTQGPILTMIVSSNVLGLYVCVAHNTHGSHQSRAVAVELKGCQGSTAPYIMCGILIFFIILITAVDLIKYNRLLKRLKKFEETREATTYTNLQITNDSTVYNEIQKTASRTEEDYENKHWAKH